MNTRTALLLCLYCMLCKYSFAQNYFYDNRYYEKDFLYEISASSGIINCLTDIGGNKGVGKNFVKDLNWGNIGLAGGLMAGMIYRYILGLHFQFNTGNIRAYDSILKNDQSEGINRYRRNLHFKSNITEFLLTAEFYPITLLQDNEYKKARIYSPYIIAGIGFFHFNPQAQLNGQWIDLQPLHTEGQGFTEYADRVPYKLTQINFPAGAGIKVELSALLNLRFEILHRFTRTDYLDDVSTRYIDPSLFQGYLSPENTQLALQLHDRQKELNPFHETQPGAVRGNSNKKDTYFAAQLKIGLIIGREKR